MPLSPLSTVTDYQTMLNRIFWFTTGAALAAVWLLRVNLPGLDHWLTGFEFKLQFGADKMLPVPAGYLLPALAVGLSSRIFRIHSKLGDWLGIRERFDIDVILGELADRTDCDIRHVPDEDLVYNRHHLMRRAFYPFVSGSRPQIDESLIQRALDLWSWLWIGLEASLLFSLTGLALIASGVTQPGLTVLLTTLGLAAVGLPAIRRECRRHGIAQVRAIVENPLRAQQVKQAFAPLLQSPLRNPNIDPPNYQPSHYRRAA